MGNQQPKFEAEDGNVAGLLWGISTRILGIGHLIKGQDRDALPCGDVTYGVGEILINLAQELDNVRERLEETQTSPVCED